MNSMSIELQTGIREYTGSLDDCYAVCLDGSVWKGNVKLFPSYEERYQNALRDGLITEDYRWVCSKCSHMKYDDKNIPTCCRSQKEIHCVDVTVCPFSYDKPPFIDDIK